MSALSFSMGFTGMIYLAPQTRLITLYNSLQYVLFKKGMRFNLDTPNIIFTTNTI